MSNLVDNRNKPPCFREDALAVLRTLRAAGHVTYFAGGCVRDLLLGMEPKDFDVATDAQPQRVRSLFSQTQAVGAAFGVVLVRQGKSVIEVATFRRDGEYLDGRRPSSVQFTRAQEDAQRRDFTINGIFLDPLTNTVVDYVGGQADLKARLIRAIGNPRQRFAEDHLRLLRAVRFAARLGFAIEPETGEALRAEAPQLKRITPERIAEELRAILPAPTRPVAWQLFWRYRLAQQIFRHQGAVAAAMIPPERSLFMNLAPGKPVPFSLALAAAVVCYRRADEPDADVRKYFTAQEVKQTLHALRQGLRLSNAELAEIEQTLGSLGIILAEQSPTLAQQKRFLATDTAEMAIELMQAERSARLLVERIDAVTALLQPLIGTEVAPAPLITGDDLTELGFSPGPAFKRLLTATYDAQLEGRIATKSDAVEFVRRLAAEPE
jgi:poly(A) polymerase